MTSAEIDTYLHQEELLTVEFLLECPGLGFLVSSEHDESTIPPGYRVVLPFWLAAILGMPQHDGRSIVKVVEPAWLRVLGPGVKLDIGRSYFFAATVGAACQDATASKRLIELAKERIQPVLDASLRSRPGRSHGLTDEMVLLSEEKELISESRRAVESFGLWKAGEIRNQKSFPREDFTSHF
jgi:hypothetical protein